MRLCGVYTITSEATGERYIGASEHMHRRWMGHLYHFERHISPKALQSAYDKGPMKFEVTCLCGPGELEDVERQYILNQKPELNLHKRGTGRRNA